MLFSIITEAIKLQDVEIYPSLKNLFLIISEVNLFVKMKRWKKGWKGKKGDDAKDILLTETTVQNKVKILFSKSENILKNDKIIKIPFRLNSTQYFSLF